MLCVCFSTQWHNLISCNEGFSEIAVGILRSLCSWYWSIVWTLCFCWDNICSLSSAHKKELLFLDMTLRDDACCFQWLQLRSWESNWQDDDRKAPTWRDSAVPLCDFDLVQSRETNEIIRINYFIYLQYMIICHKPWHCHRRFTFNNWVMMQMRWCKGWMCR